MSNKSTRELAAMLGLQVEIRLVAANGINVFDEEMTGGTFEKLTIHETANDDAGADARMHRLFVANGGGRDKVSFTYAVDDRRAVQILRETQRNIAQGTPRGNVTSLSIETCINRDGHWPTTLDNLAKLVAAILVAHNKPPSIIVQHNVWRRKNCPAQLRSVPGAWDALMRRIEGYIQTLQSLLNPPAPPEPGAEVLELNGYSVQHGFLDLWRLHGLRVMGLPISNEYRETVDLPGRGPTAITFQDFENLVTEWYEGIEPRIGAGIRKYKYGR